MQAEGELNFGPFGVAGGRQAGVSSSQEYKLYLTEDQLRQVGAGTYPLPSIADPMSLPVGGSMTNSRLLDENKALRLPTCSRQWWRRLNPT